MHYNLSDTDSIANQFLARLRDHTVQTDRSEFRRNLQRLGTMMAYEISRKFRYHPSVVTTPLGKATVPVPEELPVLITILRAGLPFFQGFQELFDQSDAGFIGAYRQEGKEHITIKLDYRATPSVAGREVILIDPMLATGRSIVDAIQVLTGKGSGVPAHLHVACLVASPEGVRYLEENIRIPYTLWSWAVDEKLDENFYIVPGLGDAGDLSFGNKI